jgi:recombination protein RecT
MANEAVALQRQPDPLRNALASPAVKGRFEEMLGKNSAGFISSIVSAVNANPQLKQCDPMSVISSAAIAASMGLPINSSLGLAHIVPYKSKNGYVAQFQIGWKGFIQLALRSGKYKTINLTRVYEGEIVEHNKFTGEMEFNSNRKASERVTGYLLYFKLINGFEKYFYMTTEELEDHAKKYSRSFQSGRGVWSDDFEAMAMKTVCKLGLSKYGMLSLDTEIHRAVESDQSEINPRGDMKYPDNEAGPTGVDVDARKAIDEKYTVAAPEVSLETGEVFNPAADDMPDPFTKGKKQ